MTDAPIPQYVTAHELAALLAVPTSWIYHRTRAGCKDPIPHAQFGKYTRFDLTDPALREWLERHKVGGNTRADRGLKVVS